MLTKKFNMNDLGVLDVILGIKFCKISNKLILSPSLYVEKVLEKLYIYIFVQEGKPIGIFLNN